MELQGDHKATIRGALWEYEQRLRKSLKQHKKARCLKPAEIIMNGDQPTLVSCQIPLSDGMPRTSSCMEDMMFIYGELANIYAVAFEMERDKE